MTISRRAEPELMDIESEVQAYAQADFANVNQAFVERLLHLAGERSSLVAADLGTGPGDIPIRVAKARPHWRISAVDASAPMLAVARKAIQSRGIGNIELVLGDAKNIPLPTNCADVIFSNSLLHHVSSPTRLWQEIKRIAKPQALLVLRDLARPASEDAARAFVVQYAGTESPLLQEEFHRSLLAAYTPAEVQMQLETAGLKGLKVEMVSDRHLDVFGTIDS